MTDKTYNNLSELYNTIPSEEAKKYSNHDMEKSRIPNLRNNIDVEPEGYFDDETAGQKRTDNYENIEKVENIVTEVVADDKLILVRTHSYVGLAHEAPKFSQDNEFILHGYRVNFHTCETIAKSLCLCHNETVNVWTHLVGALFTVILIIVTGITVGPYGYRINEPWRADHHKINFKKYSFPFYSSVPIFHNSRLFLSYLNMNLRKISNNTISDNLNHIDYNRTENFFIKSIDDYSSLFDDINEMEEDINCASCIEDFVRNMFTIKEFVEDTINYMDVINEKKAGLFNDSIRDKLISFQNIIDKFILKMIKKTEKLKILNDYEDLTEYGKYGYETNAFNSNIRLVKWPIYIQLICAIICLSCSSTYHLFLAYSHKVVEILSRLDYAGISILIAGSCFPAYYYFYYCDFLYRSIYLGFITGFALFVFLFSLTPKFNKPEKRKLRGLLFLLLGISTAVPIIHLAFFFNPNVGMMEDPQLFFWYTGGAIYITGCLIYIFRFPERFFPGKFDLIGSSHQIWHIFVLVGIIFHHFASLHTYYDRVNHECPS